MIFNFTKPLWKVIYMRFVNVEEFLQEVGTRLERMAINLVLEVNLSILVKRKRCFHNV